MEGSKKYAPIVLILAAVIPSSYLGYAASSWFEIECSSRVTYERLSDQKFWAPHRLGAAKALFDQIAYCVDRNATLLFDKPSTEDMRRLKKWRTFISVVNAGLADKSTVANRFSQHDSGRDIEMTWGDSIYERIYGYPWVVVENADFDKVDFRLLIDANEACSKINADTAKSLYSDIEQRTMDGDRPKGDRFKLMREQRVKDLH